MTSRRTAVAGGSIAFAVLGAFFPGLRSSDFEWQEAVPRGYTVEVRGIIGTIHAEPSSGGQARVVGTRIKGEHGEPNGVEIRIMRVSRRIIICTVYPRDRRWGSLDESDESDESDDVCEAAQRNAPTRGRNDTRIDFRVQVPAGVHFVGQTVTDDVVLRGLRGNAEGYSVAGDVAISDVRGTAIDAATIGGRIDLLDLDAGQVYGGTLSGDVHFKGKIHAGGDYSFLSYAGEVIIELPNSAGVSFTVNAPRDDVRSVVPLSPSPSARRRMFGRQGNGSAEMTVTSLSGGVEIRKADSP